MKNKIIGILLVSLLLAIGFVSAEGFDDTVNEQLKPEIVPLCLEEIKVNILEPNNNEIYNVTNVYFSYVIGKQKEESLENEIIDIGEIIHPLPIEVNYTCKYKLDDMTSFVEIKKCKNFMLNNLIEGNHTIKLKVYSSSNGCGNDEVNFTIKIPVETPIEPPQPPNNGDGSSSSHRDNQGSEDYIHREGMYCKLDKQCEEGLYCKHDPEINKIWGICTKDIVTDTSEPEEIVEEITETIKPEQKSNKVTLWVAGIIFILVVVGLFYWVKS